MSRILRLFLIDRIIIGLIVLAVVIAIIPQIYWQSKAVGGDLTGAWAHQGSPAGTIVINARLMFGSANCSDMCATYHADGNSLNVDWVWWSMSNCPYQFTPADLQFGSYYYSVEGDTLYLYKGFWETLEFERDPTVDMNYSDSC